MTTKAKVKAVQMCKSCGVELLLKDQRACQVCGSKQSADDIKTKFSPPDYLFYQRQDQISGLKTNNTEAGMKEIDHDMLSYIKASVDEDKIAAMYDALHTLKLLVLSDCTIDTLRTVTKMGKVIGKLAVSIEEYSKNQGVINVSTPKVFEFDIEEAE